MIFHVLCPLEAHSSTGAVVDLGTREAGTVPGVLLLHPNARARTDELVRPRWPEHAAAAGAKADLKTYVSQLRCALPPFGAGNRTGRGGLDSDRAAEPAADALVLWRGRPFEGLERELLDAAPGVALTAAVTTGPGGGAVLRIAAITTAAAELPHAGARRGARLERLDGRHASAVAATLPIGGGSL